VASDSEAIVQTVLSQLNTIPGVVGSFVCDRDGQIQAQMFPPVFGANSLLDAARTLADITDALDFTSEAAELLEVRFKAGWLLAKPFPDSVLVVLCTEATNVQLLAMAVGAGVAKLDKLRQGPSHPPDSTETVRRTAPSPTPAPSALAHEVKQDGDSTHRKRVAAPTKGLEELRRRLAGAARGLEGPSSAVGPVPPTTGEHGQKPDEAEAPGSSGIGWWEGMP
jgi:predicted regulator of Ras-like GTPase activity (Roadblock/LC7/MglB family)